METIVYKIGGIEYEQSELTWKQDKRLVGLYNKIQSAGGQNEELRLKDVQILLAKYNLINRFFGIILRPRISFKYVISFKWIEYYLFKTITLESATNSQIGQIFRDFFLLNQAFAMQLKDWANTLGLIASETAKQKPNAGQ